MLSRNRMLKIREYPGKVGKSGFLCYNNGVPPLSCPARPSALPCARFLAGVWSLGRSYAIIGCVPKVLAPVFFYKERALAASKMLGIHTVFLALFSLQSLPPCEKSRHPDFRDTLGTTQMEGHDLERVGHFLLGHDDPVGAGGDAGHLPRQCEEPPQRADQKGYRQDVALHGPPAGVEGAGRYHPHRQEGGGHRRSPGHRALRGAGPHRSPPPGRLLRGTAG